MKHLLFTIFLFFVSALSFGQILSSDEIQIKKLITGSFDEIWSELKTESIEKFHTKDFLLLENGEVWNNDSIANYLSNTLKQAQIPKRVNNFEFIEIKILNGMAWVAYQNEATFLIEDKVVRKAHWLESATAVSTENGWRLQMLHSTWVKNE